MLLILSAVVRAAVFVLLASVNQEVFMKLTCFRFFGAALVVVAVTVAVVRSQEGYLARSEGLAADWKLEKEIPAIDGGSIQIPATKLTVWVEQGWLVAR